jgi:magnesium-protoporphyrin O-methyltransferase
MSIATYLERRGELETYFDRTAVDAWARLTSDAPVGRIRATVRAGRDEMRNTLLSWLPQNMNGARLLDAGCGTGALSIEAARRGARVVAVDLIHYRLRDICRIVAGLAGRTDAALLVTFAPKTPALAVMHAVGRLFPRGDRAPAIEPVSERRLRQTLTSDEGLESWQLGRSCRIASGFYKSQALEMVPR